MRGVITFFLAAAFGTLLFSCIKSDPDPALLFEEQWKQDTTEIASYLRANNINAMVDPMGVRIVIDSMTEGYPPRANSTIRFKYTGRLLSGTQFDAGNLTGLVSSFVEGFQAGLFFVPEGGKARIYIPSGFAYGTSGASTIPPNSNIMFEIQLLEIIKTTAEKQQLGSDTVAIDEYLASKSINAVKDKSGLRYVITELGTGPIPGRYNKVKMNYTGKLLSDGTEFFNGSVEPSNDFDSRVIKFIYGIQNALIKLPEGSKATLYIPSGLGFATQEINTGSVIVPANSNLIYNVELLEVVD